MIIIGKVRRQPEGDQPKGRPSPTIGMKGVRRGKHSGKISMGSVPGAGMLSLAL